MVEPQEVVVSGISGRFPDSGSLEEFAKNLFSGSNLQKKVPSRWNPRFVDNDNLLTTGKIPNFNYFDATFFGITSKLVRASDPLLGKCLETGFEAMVDAGVNPYAKKGHNIGVITASSISDSEILRILDVGYIDGQGMVGHSRTMLANRISYCFNFNGPSYNCDNSWTSSTQGLDIAARMVARGEVEGVLLIGCNLVSFYAQDLEYKGMSMLSPDGRTLPFDDQANGLFRSEGVVSIYLQRATDAKRNYCSVLKAQYCPLGDRSCCFVAVDGKVSDFIRNFYKDCKVNIGDVSYIEAHGVGHHEADALELNALANTLSPSPEKPLLVGALSGNVGNCESSSGLVSLAKVIIAMESGVIPPTVNYQTANSNVPALSDGRIQVVSEPTPLTGDLVGINNFSLTGAVSHVLVKRNCKTGDCQSADSLPRLVLLQARHEDGAQQLLNKLSSSSIDVQFLSMANDVFRVPIPAYLWRGYAITSTSDTKFTSGTQPYDSTARPVWFVFSGMGSQWAGMGRDLLRIPVFMAAIDRCDQVLRPIGLDIKHIITTDDTSVFDNVLNCFVGIAAIQIGLVDILNSLGVTPDGMVGHSVGELACGYADGCLTAEQMVLAAYARGKASLETEDISGMMAAVGLGYSDIKDHLPPSIDVACHNSPTSCTLSGPTSDVMDYVDKLKQDGVFAKAVSAGGIAYHSRHMKAVGAKLLQYLKKVIPDPKPRSVRWVSSSVPQDQWDILDSQLCSAEYHTNNLLSPVLFEEACYKIPENAVMIEIAPRGLLQAILRRSVSQNAISLSLTSNTTQSNVSHLLNTVGKLFLNNIDVDVNALYPPVSYPVSRGCPSLASLVTWDHDTVLYQEFASKVKSLTTKASVETVVDISPESPHYQLWTNRKIHGAVVIPVTQLLEYTWEYVFQTQRLQLDQSTIVVDDCVLPHSQWLRTDGTEVIISCTPVGLKFEIKVGHEMYTKEKNVATGKLQRISEGGFTTIILPEDFTVMEDITDKEMYGVMKRFGLEVTPPLQVVKNIIIGVKNCFCTVEWTGSLSLFLDALLQVITFLQIDRYQSLLTPTSVKKMAVDISYFKNIAPGSLIHVQYDYHCDRLVCEGAEVLGVTFRHTPPAKIPTVSWSKLQLVPLAEQLLLTDFLRSCVQLVANIGLSCWSPDPSPVNILIIKDDSEKNIFTKYFSSVMNTTLHFPVKISEVRLDEAKQLLSGRTKNRYLLAGNLNGMCKIEQCVENPKNLYVIANMKKDGKTNGNTQFRKILVNCLVEDDVKLVLMKIGENAHQVKVYEIKSADWMWGLRQLMEGGDTTTPVVVVTSQLPVEILPRLAVERYVDRIRTFFILDKDAPRFTVSCQLYRDQLSLGLPVNILSGGTWSSLNIVGLDLQCKNTSHIQSSQAEIDLKFIGLNTSHFTLDLKDNEYEGEIKHVDYSGTLNGQRVMGVGQLESYTNKLTPDHTLQWSVPDSWTMEEAATVPVVYTLAYYCMMINAQVKPGETVLVQAGLSPVGQAVIRIVLEVGGVVIASVFDDDQAIQLRRLFPQLGNKHIIVLSRQDLKTSVNKLTVGRGVEVVVNCLRGKMLQSSVGVMGFDCRFLHLGKVTPEDRDAVGMLAFLKRTSFCGISLDSVASLPQPWKESIRNLLQNGLKFGTVRPLCKTVYPPHNIKAATNITTTMAESKTVVALKSKNNNGHKRPCENTNVAVILCSKKTQFWIDVIEWVTAEGYKKVVMLTDEEEEEQDDGDYFRRLNQLVHRHNSNIVVTSSSRLDSPKSTRSLVNELVRLGTITSIITVNMDENNERLVNLEAASRQLAHPVRQWVSLLGRGEAVSQSRLSAGLSVCCVRTNSPLHSPARLLQDLSTVLDVGPTTSKILLVCETSATACKEYHEHESFSQLSLDNIIKFSESVTEKPMFTEVKTRSPGYLQVSHDLLPLFVVPGPCWDLRPLLSKLINPAFVSSMPSMPISVQDHAEILLQDILKIQEKGQYNILCDLWSSAVALEVCCLLESRGHTVQLFLLEGGPVMAQEKLRAFCDIHNTDLATGLVAESFNLTPEIIKKLCQLQGWDDKLGVALRAGQVPETVKVKLSRSLTSVYHQLTALQLFQAPSQLFSGDLTVISHQELSSSDVDGISQMCQQRPALKTTHDKTYNDLLNNFLTVTIINDTMYHNWYL